MVDFSRLHDKEYRLNNLYYIVDRYGSNIKFEMNAVQRDVFRGMHTRNLILKARQLGMSSFSVLYLLDEAIFNYNISAGIVSYSLQHAQHIFKRIIGHALTHMPREIGSLGILSQSATEISFSNGSHLRVDTSLRGGTCQVVLISEFGKTCARSPQKADEIVAGTLNTLSAKGVAIIESTGEGTEGYFADMCTEASARGNNNLSALEYKLFFYPWYLESTYCLPDPVKYSIEMADYFASIEEAQKIKLSEGQKYWYVRQVGVLGDKVRQEFPSTVSESFLSNSDAYYYASAIDRAREEGRILATSPYDPIRPVCAALDIGVNDLTAIVFFQCVHGEMRIIDYYEDSNKGVDFYARHMLNEKKYLYDAIYLPHDAARRDGLIVENTYEREFKKLFAHTTARIRVLPRHDVNLGIYQVKLKLDKAIFDDRRTKVLREHLSKYRKKWHEATGRYLDDPLHDIHCFIGSTVVSMQEGTKRIDTVVIGDKVRTPSGYKVVTAIHRSKTRRLIKITTNKGVLECTPHHKIFTENGLVRADSLRYGIHPLTLQDNKTCQSIAYHGRAIGLGFKEYFLSTNQEQLLFSMAQHTKKINLDILKAMVSSIERYGSTSTDRFQKTIMYTMLTATSQIIVSRILNLCRLPTTYAFTCHPMSAKKCHEGALERLSRQQGHGTVHRKERSGIASMPNLVLQIVRNWCTHAFAVLKFLSLYSGGQNIAQTAANRNIVGKQELTTKLENAKYATRNLSVTGTIQKCVVLQVAEQCLDIEREVYDLTVEDDHCYYANNILVSNSNAADSIRYACQGAAISESNNSNAEALAQHRRVTDSRAKRI